MINKRKPPGPSRLLSALKAILILLSLAIHAKSALSRVTTTANAQRTAQSKTPSHIQNVIPIIRARPPSQLHSKLTGLAATLTVPVSQSNDQSLNMLFSNKLGILKMKSFGKTGTKRNVVFTPKVNVQNQSNNKMLSRANDNTNDADQTQRPNLGSSNPTFSRDDLKPTEIENQINKEQRAQEAIDATKRRKLIKMREEMKRGELLNKANLISDQAILKLINRRQISNDLFDDGTQEYKEKVKNTIKNKYSKEPKNSVESQRVFEGQLKTIDRKIKRLEPQIKNIDFESIFYKHDKTMVKNLVDQESISLFISLYLRLSTIYFESQEITFIIHTYLLKALIL